MPDKLVIVADQGLDSGQQANVIALVGVSIGCHLPHVVGPDVTDASGQAHRGMSMVGLPVLQGSRDALRDIWDQAMTIPELTVLDVPDVAIASRDYETYTVRLADPSSAWRPAGLALYGPRKRIDRLTGRLALLR